MTGLSAARATTRSDPVGAAAVMAARKPLRGVAQPLAANAALGRHEAEADRSADAVLAGELAPNLGMQRAASGGARPSAPANSAGAPLAPTIRHEMERGFGADFSQVRIHADPPAALAARRNGARAYTDGENVVFGAAEYQPGNRGGRHLLAHELAHVLQQREGAPRFQRKPLDYDPTSFTVLPPKGGTLTLAQAQAMTQDAVTNGELSSANVLGAAKGSNEEIMLHYILAVTGQKSRWGTEIDLVTAIGLATPPTPAPVGKVTVRIDDKGAGEAELVSTGTVVAPTTFTSRADAETKLKATYGFIDVKDTTNATWSLDELNLVGGALARVTLEPGLLKGVTLLRVDTISVAGQPAGGEFETDQSVSGTTVTDDATLSLANSVFPTTPTNFTGGKTSQASASYLTVLHEVGHAVEGLELRKKTRAHFDAIAARNKLVDEQNALLTTEQADFATLDTSVNEFNNLTVEANNLQTARDQARRSGDAAALRDAQAALDAKVRERTAKGAEVTTNRASFNRSKAAEQAKSAQIKTAATTRDTAAKAKEDVTARPTLLARATTAGGTATAALTRAKGASGAASADSADYRNAADDAGKALTDFAKGVKDKADDVDVLRGNADTAVQNMETERTNFETAHPSDPMVTVYAPVAKAQRAWFDALALVLDEGGQSLRVRKFIDFVTANKILPFTSYAATNWPQKPGEFFAESYSLFLSDPDYLKKNSLDLYNWFAGGRYK